MSSSLTHKILIDERLESYRSFFDHNWAKDILSLAAGTKLDDAAFSLCINWKAAANTHLVPWFAVGGFSQFVNGFLRSHEPFGKKVVDVLAQRMPAEMGTSMRHMQKEKFADIIRRIGAEVYDASEKAKEQEKLLPDAFWQEFLSTPESSEFRLIIWGSQRICYGAIYHAYEHFVRECVRVAQGQGHSSPRRDTRSLLAAAKKSFGSTLATDCLASKEVRIARLVRNALAHNGGRETADLKKVTHGISVEDGVLQIMAPDNHSLFELLKDRAHRLAENTIAMPGVK